MRRARAEPLPLAPLLSKPQVLAAALLLFLAPSLALSESPPQGLLWSLAGPGGKPAMLIAGSIHLQRKSPGATLPPAYLEAFHGSSCLVLETDPGALAGEEFGRLILRSGTLPEGTDLEELLDPRTRGLLVGHLRRRGLPLEDFRRLRPWLAALLLVRHELEVLGYRPELGLEERFYQLALENDKLLLFLESPVEQLEPLAGLDPGSARELLRDSLVHMDSLGESTALLAAAWRAGDARAMEMELAEAFGPLPGLQQRLLGERNRRWVGQIENLLAEGRECLVLVGSAHLLGPQNLIDLLAARGHPFERRRGRPAKEQSQESGFPK